MSEYGRKMNQRGDSCTNDSQLLLLDQLVLLDTNIEKVVFLHCGHCGHCVPRACLGDCAGDGGTDAPLLSLLLSSEKDRDESLSLWPYATRAKPIWFGFVGGLRKGGYMSGCMGKESQGL